MSPSINSTIPAKRRRETRLDASPKKEAYIITQDTGYQARASDREQRIHCRNTDIGEVEGKELGLQVGVSGFRWSHVETARSIHSTSSSMSSFPALGSGDDPQFDAPIGDQICKFEELSCKIKKSSEESAPLKRLLDGRKSVEYDMVMLKIPRKYSGNFLPDFGPNQISGRWLGMHESCVRPALAVSIQKENIREKLKPGQLEQVWACAGAGMTDGASIGWGGGILNRLTSLVRKPSLVAPVFRLKLPQPSFPAAPAVQHGRDHLGVGMLICAWEVRDFGVCRPQINARWTSIRPPLRAAREVNVGRHTSQSGTSRKDFSGWTLIWTPTGPVYTKMVTRPSPGYRCMLMTCWRHTWDILKK
ncbi:hypothetical protein B0H17DRAFT_1141513 [Mycena rosella]|uniref:Uncharacterized protein n=1 Tax=Mycena rosella TaxID=1033263 RepID=A0AAD7CZI9_MYCRO|nr:hypothetical protein B0H17DRAFT_1141513 [Mycena rosella]